MAWAIGGLLFRSAVILGLAELCCRLARRTGAVHRHRILLAGFVLLFLWPVLAAIIPEMRVPLFAASHQNAGVIVQQRVLSTGAVRRSPSTGANWPLTIWLAGFMLSLSPVAIGYSKALALVRRSTPVPESDVPVPLGKVRFRAHRGVVVPFVFGLWRPTILVPIVWANWPASRKRAVLLHELAHVQRRDLIWQFLASGVTALWWFQPLCWYNRRSLRSECEAACDALAIESGLRASEYAAELLAIAEQIRSRPSYRFAAIAMAERRDLQRRICTILQAETSGRVRRPIAAVALLISATLTVSAVSIVRETSNKSGGISMKRTLFSGLLATAGLSAATITGSVYDQNGKPIGNAHVSVVNPDTSIRQETTTTPDGRFEFNSLGAGSYILRVDKSQFAALYREFNVQEDTDVQRGLVLEPGKTAEGDTDIQAPQEPVRVAGRIAENNLVRKVAPVYPVPAKQAHVQGTVRLNVTISKQGVPQDLRVVSSPSDDLTQSALEAVRQWRYRPTLLNGQPVDITTEVIVNYTLLP